MLIPTAEVKPTKEAQKMGTTSTAQEEPAMVNDELDQELQIIFSFHSFLFFQVKASQPSASFQMGKLQRDDDFRRHYYVILFDTNTS